MLVAASPVFKEHRYPILRESAQAHADHHFIKGEKFRQVLTRHPRGDERKVAPQLVQHVGGMISQEQLTATPLPTQVIGVVYVSDEVRFFKANDMSVFLNLHSCSS